MFLFVVELIMFANYFYKFSPNRCFTFHILVFFQAALGVYFHLYNTDHPAAEDLQWLSLVSIMLFFISYFGGKFVLYFSFIWILPQLFILSKQAYS